MPKLINADALADRLEALAYDVWNQGASTTWANALEDFAEMVRDELAVDVEPVRHGRWIMKSDPYGFFEIPVCSECGRTTKTRNKTKFCPNCGAKMENGERK